MRLHTWADVNNLMRKDSLMNPGKNYKTKPFPVVEKIDSIILNATLDNDEKVTLDFSFKDGVVTENAVALSFDYTHCTTTLSFNWTSFELRIIYH